jgi:hypothetical protein
MGVTDVTDVTHAGVTVVSEDSCYGSSYGGGSSSSISSSSSSISSSSCCCCYCCVSNYGSCCSCNGCNGSYGRYLADGDLKVLNCIVGHTHIHNT